MQIDQYLKLKKGLKQSVYRLTVKQSSKQIQEHYIAAQRHVEKAASIFQPCTPTDWWMNLLKSHKWMEMRRNKEKSRKLGKCRILRINPNSSSKAKILQSRTKSGIRMILCELEEMRNSWKLKFLNKSIWYSNHSVKSDSFLFVGSNPLQVCNYLCFCWQFVEAIFQFQLVFQPICHPWQL